VYELLRGAGEVLRLSFKLVHFGEILPLDWKSEPILRGSMVITIAALPRISSHPSQDYLLLESLSPTKMASTDIDTSAPAPYVSRTQHGNA
jgi:hypothetical protein